MLKNILMQKDYFLLVLQLHIIAHYTMTREELVESAKKVFDAILSGKFKVEISKKYSLDDAKKAHEELEARLLTGPAVIIPN